MLSAFWGDPPDHHSAPRKGFEKYLARFNHWFDHQADRYGNVIAWALHHRRSMAVIALVTFVTALGSGIESHSVRQKADTDAGTTLW